MEELKAKGIILNEMPIGENDKRVTIFTKEYGKIISFAKNAKKQKSKLLAGTQIFAFSNFVLYKTSKSINITQIESIETFYDIRKDIYKLSYAMYMLDILNYVGEENEPNEELLKLILKTLQVIKKDRIELELIIHIYELKLMSYCGFSPEVSKCVFCNNKFELLRFSPKEGGLVCSKCINKQTDSITILEGTLYALRYILFSDLNELYKFNVSKEVLEQLSTISRQFISYHLDKKFKTLEFLNKL